MGFDSSEYNPDNITAGTVLVDPMTQIEIDLLYSVLLLADITSIIGTFIVLIGFWRLKLLRNHVTRVISCFCLTSFLKDLMSMTLTLTDSAQYGGFPCYLYSIVITYGSLSCWLWTLCLAISIYLMIVRRYPEPEKLERYYFFVCWGLPLISTIIMLSKDLVHFLGNWCWIGEQYTPYRFALFYVPFFIIFGVSAILVGLTCHYTYQVIHNGVSDNKDKHITYQFKLVNYIIVFLVCWIFAVINRILNAIGLFPYACNLLHTYLSLSHGFYASVAFIYNNPLMWRFIGSKFIRLFTIFGFCVETAKRLEKNKNNNNPSPYSSSRGPTITKLSNNSGIEMESSSYDDYNADGPEGADNLRTSPPLPPPVSLSGDDDIPEDGNANA
ncbi:G-protein-coupled receptor [Heterostelium album PN500]|uniref:G-protein-coupled receptor n=2 Tax=Heterostelium TaxID=2058189 RepID=A0A1X9FN43_HETP5|nr:G-protein-coupled receptor [Heterostelium album PN500]EFA84701.1 G-protein-coupled receptor [Heterostelium album PN500]BAA99285.1 cAMP receptor TasA [Heterostelium pallidum]|eukprot:XP_020436814.1 G-protein-coupled receptor [Heterostelium album PN500]